MQRPSPPGGPAASTPSVQYDSRPAYSPAAQQLSVGFQQGGDCVWEGLPDKRSWGLEAGSGGPAGGGAQGWAAGFAGSYDFLQLLGEFATSAPSLLQG